MNKLVALWNHWLAGMTPDQWWLMGLSLLAAWLVTDHRPIVQRWGPVFGLCSQPFWLYSGWTAMQGGIFVMSVFYTLLWSRGIYNGWFRVQREPLPELPRVPRDETPLGPPDERGVRWPRR